MKSSFIKKAGVSVALLSSVLTAAAYDFEADGIYYNVLSEENLTVEVTYSKRWAKDYKGEIAIPPVCKNGETEYAVAAIGEDAFYMCNELTSVTIPSSVTEVGVRAFYQCGALASVSMPNSVTVIDAEAFYLCKALTYVTIPNSVETIGGNAFANCEGLSEITIPGKVSSIGRMAFFGCDGLTTIHLPASVTEVGEAAFSDCPLLTSITVDDDSRALSSVDGILYDKQQTSVICCPNGFSGDLTLPGTVTTIAGQAFRDCAGLTSVAFPNSLRNIGDAAFMGCSYLTAIALPEALTSIGRDAFFGCRFTTISIPGSVTLIADGAFNGCRDMTSIEVAEGNAAYSSVDGILYNKSQTELLYCPVMKSGSVTIPNTVTAIRAMVFEGCQRLSAIVIPLSVTSIGRSAFSGCMGLRSIYVEWDTPIEGCSSDAFDSYLMPDATLYVPQGTVEAYRAVEPWSRFSIIEEYNPNTGIDEIESGSWQDALQGNVLVFNAAGVVVYDGPSENLPTLPRGIYIVKTDSSSIKIAF